MRCRITGVAILALALLLALTASASYYLRIT
jgi:hypothetical protein